ncbi:hypothetical protein R1sor_013503 [Riccia sorocarpa]|uniref:Uncharacterized protein n=1 Tax=Riccia sorocarpa TaxID=122646 RepID=A0ABD3H9K8_9MARC
MKLEDLLRISLACLLLVPTCRAGDPTPKPWPSQFHALLFENFTTDGNSKLSIIDLWYDWKNGRNYNIIQDQLGHKLWDAEWNNGTAFHFDLEQKTCQSVWVGVGILRPDFLSDAQYVGVQTVDTFTCNVWNKLDNFITYYEEVETQRPVGWLFYTGRFEHVITFEEGAVLSDSYWQAPEYCFTDEAGVQEESLDSGLILQNEGREPLERWLNGLSS